MDGDAAMTAFVDAVGLPYWQDYFNRAPTIARRAARLAINDSAERKGLKLARESMLAQVNFPSGYLAPPRFGLKQRATDGNLVATIGGRFTPTSLARFSGGRRSRRAGVRVQVQRGRSTELPRAFLINLRNGNVGLAIRLRPGETLRHTIGAKLITSGPLAGVALLYGPSVDQVFRTVAVDISPPLLDNLQSEFLRQFQRLFNA
jgi:hypothetical protein